MYYTHAHKIEKNLIKFFNKRITGKRWARHKLTPFFNAPWKRHKITDDVIFI